MLKLHGSAVLYTNQYHVPMRHHHELNWHRRIAWYALVALMLVGLLGSHALAQQDLYIQTNDGLRRFYSVEPSSEYKRPLPLVIALHGLGQEPFRGSPSFRSRSRWDEVARSEGFIAVFPEGGILDNIEDQANRSWNAGACCPLASTFSNDDVGFVRQIIDRYVSMGQTLPEMVFLTGFSNGGMLAYRCACELGPQVRAIGVVAGTDAFSEDCAPVARQSLIHIHSTDDNVVGYDSWIFFPSTEESVSRWLSRLNSGDLTEPDSLYKISLANGRLWQRHSDSSRVELLVSDQGGHSWPGDPLSGQEQGFDATEVIWNFFRRQMSWQPSFASTFSVQSYPNPANESVRFKVVGQVETQGRLVIADLEGRSVLETDYDVSDGTAEIDIETKHLASGVYFIQARTIQATATSLLQIVR